MIKRSIKRFIAKYLGFWALPEHSYTQMTERHNREIEIFQSHCSHKELNFDFHPFAICANCQKVVRMATKEEQTQAVQKCWDRLNKGLDKETLESIETTPTAISGFYTDDGTPI